MRTKRSPAADAACRRRTCTYYTHYLPRGAAGFGHEAFHAAEAFCEAAQAHYERLWADGIRDERLQAAERVCEMWERRIRA
jgi:hypothetical protein